MKLVGEYEITDTGVRIEGKIKDTHIREVAKVLKPFGSIVIYKGSNKEQGSSRGYYSAPHPKYRNYIRQEMRILNHADEKPFVRQADRIGEQVSARYNDGTSFMHSMGIQYSDGGGDNIVIPDRSIDFVSGSSRDTLLTNSAWVWGVKADGTFNIELDGLVNKHIMQMVLAKATLLAKYIDEVLVRVIDRADDLTESKILAARRVGLEIGSWR